MTGPDLVPGEPAEVAPLVRRILAPNPGLLTGPGTNTYLVGGAEVAVIDPGPDDPAHLDAVEGAGEGRIRWILVTHSHGDHAPGARGLAERTGAQVLGFGPRPTFVPHRSIGDGFCLATAEFTLEALHTPGHASDHLCYLLDGGRLLFSGDHVMAGSTVVVAPPDGDMAAYVAALRRLRTLPLAAIGPGHGPLLADPVAVLDAYLEHRQRREEAIAAALAAGDTTVDEVVARVYTDVSPALHPVARLSVHAHLRKLAAEGRAVGWELDGSWTPA